MLRGTRIISGDDAALFSRVTTRLSNWAREYGFEEIIVPAIWDLGTFVTKAGPDLSQQIWNFSDKSDRAVCLIPEVTGIIQEIWNEGLHKTKKKPWQVFYLQRCYRYEKPQEGRYREFTQFGIEVLGGGMERPRAKELLNLALLSVGIKGTEVPFVKRGLSYYTEEGFEVEFPLLGAQKQIAGGGRYPEGIGWAIGVDRVVMAIQRTTGDIPPEEPYDDPLDGFDGVMGGMDNYGSLNS